MWYLTLKGAQGTWPSQKLDIVFSIVLTPVTRINLKPMCLQPTILSVDVRRLRVPSPAFDVYG